MAWSDGPSEQKTSRLIAPAGILGTIALLTLPHSLPVVAGAAALYGGYVFVKTGWQGLRSVGKWRHRPAVAIKPPPTLPPPPPPTADEVGRMARERYESSLRVLEAAGLDSAELEAARTRAKQLYLREIDGLL